MTTSEIAYEDYRNQFSTEDEFRRCYGRLTEAEARGLVERSPAEAYEKPGMVRLWRLCQRLVSGEDRITRKTMDVFDETLTLDKYRELVRICLTDYCNWSEYWDNPELVDLRMEQNEAFIRSEYAAREAPMDAAVEVGFCCG